jgi:dihydrofolate reductase
MRRLIVTENITLDGVVEAVDDWFLPAGGGDDVAAATREHMAGADAVLLGRVTYQQFADYWPKRTDDTTGVRDYLNRTRKYVVSSTLARADWPNSTILRGPLAAEVAALKGQPGKDIVATGSVTLAQALVREGLVDEYRLFVYPRILGRGRRLFPGGVDATVRLAEARTFRSGLVLLTYRLASAQEAPR